MKSKLVNGVALVAVDPAFTVLEGDNAFFALLDETRENYRLHGNSIRGFMTQESAEQAVSDLTGCPDCVSREGFIERKDGSMTQISATGVRIPGMLYEDRYPVYHLVLVDVTSLRQGTEASSSRSPAALVEKGGDISFEYDFASDSMCYGEGYGFFFVGPLLVHRFCEGVPPSAVSFENAVASPSVSANIHFSQSLPDTAAPVEAAPSENDVNVFFRSLIVDIAAGVETFTPEFRFVTTHGTRWFSVFCTTLRDTVGNPAKLVGLLRDIEGRKEEELRLFNKSRSDGMTGLRNKTAAEEEIRAALHALRPGALCALLMIDVDDFKSVNDTMGHQAGDEVILRISQQLLGMFRKEDVVGRAGGDEFYVCIRDVVSPETACEKARQLCESIPRLFAEGELADRVFISVGIGFAERGKAYEELVREADIALYDAKARGKNGYEVFGHVCTDSEEGTALREERCAGNSRQTVLGEVAKTLFNTDETNAGISKALSCIGQALDLDRIVIFAAPSGAEPGKVLWQWLNEGIDGTGGQGFAVDFAELPSEIKKEELFYCGDTARLTAEVKNRINDASLTALLRCEFVEPCGTSGHLSFELRGRPRIWTRQEADILVMLSRLLGKYFDRQRCTGVLRNNTQSARVLFDALCATAVFVISRENRKILYCNDKARRLIPGAAEGVECRLAFGPEAQVCADCPLLDGKLDRPVHSLGCKMSFGPDMNMSIAIQTWAEGEQACAVMLTERLGGCEEEHARKKRRDAFTGTLCASYEYVVDIDPATGRFEHFIDDPKLHQQLSEDYTKVLATVCNQCVSAEHKEQYRATFSLEAMQKTFDAGAAQIRMEYVRIGDGDRWMERFAVPYTLEDGTRRIVAYSRDITERKEAEEIARNLEARYHRVFCKSWDLVCEVNLQTWTYTQTIFRKKNLFSLVQKTDYHSVFRFVSEELIYFRDLPTLRRVFSPQSLLRARRNDTDINCRYRLSDGNGRNVWMESRVVFIEENGVPKAFFLTRDITSLKLAEDSQQQREQGFSLALQSTYSQIYELDAEQATSRLIYRNDNRLLVEFPDGPICSKGDVEQNIHPDDRARFQKIYNLEALKLRMVEGAGKLTAEYRILTRDGKYHWVSVELLALRELDGQGKVLVLLRDEQERKEQAWRKDRYDRALCAIYDEVFELNITQDWYRTVYHLKDKYVAPPEEGVLSEYMPLMAEQMISPEDTQRFLDFFDLEAIRTDFKNGREHRQGEFRKLCRDGKYSWASLTVFPLAFDSDGDESYLVFIMDIDARKESEAIARQNALLERRRLDDRRYKVIVDQTGTLVFEWGVNGVSQYLSPEIPRRFMGTYDQRDVLRIWLEDSVIHEADKAGLEALLGRIAAGDDHTEMRGRLHCREGADIWCRIGCSRLRDRDGRQDRFIGTLNDVDATVRSVNALKYRAEYDSLTGIYNMHSFYTHTEHLLREHPERQYSIIRMDIDRFKVINDLYGLEGGNQLLCHVAKLLREKVRDHGVWGRISGDIFCMCVDLSGDQVLALLQDIGGALTRYPLAHRIAAYFGICRVDNIETPVNILCDWANLALRTVKGSYLTNYAFYDGTLRDGILAEKKIENEMHGALTRGEFIMYLQPKVDIQTSQVIGAEGLARWRTAEGLIPPMQFVPLFEKNGFILRLDEHIWELACMSLRRWLDKGLREMPVSVNVSRLHIHDTRFCEKLIDLVQRYDVPPKLLELELTESAFLENESALPAAMDTLRRHGFLFSLDDFGAGYSSLNMLKNLAIDTIKIDRGFLAEGEASEQGKTVIRHTIAMARDLNLKVIAEGVEHNDQAAFLLRSGCSCAQGFYYAPPLPVEHFESMAFGLSPGSFSVVTPSSGSPSGSGIW